MSIQYFRLHPKDSDIHLSDEEALKSMLLDVGLISNEIYEDLDEICYLPGGTFYKLFVDNKGTVKEDYRTTPITYTVRIVKSLNEKAMVIDGGEYSVAPNCPKCGFKYTEYGKLISMWWENQSEFRWQCPECDISHRINSLDWHHSMGFARYSIDIVGIGWYQVAPAEQLLAALKAFAGVEFSYVYQQV